MKKCSVPFLIVLFFLFFIPLSAQESKITAEDVIESTLDRSTAEEDLRNDADVLEAFRNEPIDVSRPLYSELIRLPMVSPMLAESMILLSDSVEISGVEQYLNASLMTDALFEQIRPFITVRTKVNGNSLQSFLPDNMEMRTRTFTRHREEDNYLGGPASVYYRMRLRGMHTDALFAMEKDPGELTEHGSFSGSVSLEDLGVVQKMILGDFTVAADQGLVFARAISSSKGNNAVGQIRKKGRMLSANTSADDMNNFRGVALETSTGPFSFLCFGSRKALAASLDGSGAVTSIYVSGLFRDSLELKKKHAVNALTTGGRIGIGIGDRSAISMTLMDSRYDRSFSAEQRSFGKQQHQTAGSIAFDLSERSFSLFGETSTDNLRRYSASAGITVPLSRTISVSYHHRTFVQGYTTPFAHPFGEQSNIARGESGDYIGMSLNERGFHLNLYFDRALFPSDRESYSSQFAESFLSIEFPLTKHLTAYGHLRNKRRTGEVYSGGNDERSQSNYRVELRCKVSRKLILTNRFEISQTGYSPVAKNESGLLLFVDGAFRDDDLGMRFRTRMIFFDAPSYDSRLYQFESGVRGSYSNPPLYGKGIRWYCILGYECMRDIVISFKYAAVKKLSIVDQPAVGDFTPEFHDDLLTLQLDFQL